MMPSRATVIACNPLALLRCTGVHAPAWAAMGDVGRKRFHDGRPAFQRAADAPEAVAPLSHGKVMGAFLRDKSACTVYLGSHNFSRNAWGVPGEVTGAGRTAAPDPWPGGIELGVLLCETGQRSREIFDRFPVRFSSSLSSFSTGLTEPCRCFAHAPVWRALAGDAPTAI